MSEQQKDITKEDLRRAVEKEMIELAKENRTEILKRAKARLERQRKAK